MIQGIVAAGHEETVRAAEIILGEGGNAFDAILAAHFAACVAEPVLASLGGGGFLTALPHGGVPAVYDFFVQTPRSKRPAAQCDFRPILADFGTAQQEFHIGQGTIATPGMVKGVFRIHRELGSMPLARIVEPAIEIARRGVVVNPIQAYIFSIVHPIFTATPEAREIYGTGGPEGRVAEQGTILRQPQLADTIERLAVEGEDLFYREEIAASIVDHCRHGGGHLTADDLEHYDVVKRDPLQVEFAGARLMTNPPPSSGGILIAFGIELLKSGLQSGGSLARPAYLALLADAMALTNKARVDVLARQQEAGAPSDSVLSPNFLRVYQDEIVGRAEALRGTTQMCVIDGEGNVASMTVSNGEGCGSIVPGTGIMLNNMLGEQDLNPDGFHLWQENQRMTSMMAPSIIRTREGAVVATGSGGSNRIRTALLQVISNLAHFNMEPADAVMSPRIHLEGNKLSVEGVLAPEEIAALISRYPDHEIWPERNLFFGGAHTIMRRDDTYSGAGDPRRGGVCRIVE